MKVLVTGGAGFIGSHVARKLLERGDSVVIVDSYNSYYDPKIKTNRMSRLMGDFEGRVTDVRSDIRHRLAMESVFAESGNTRVLGQQGFFNNFDVKLSCRKEIIEIKVSRSI